MTSSPAASQPAGARPPDPAALGTVLGVWAHPDDEAYLSAAVMAAAVEAGQRVVCVTATRGEAGTDDPERWPPNLLAQIRTAELSACLAELGVTEHHWLGYADGGCADVPEEEAVAAVARLVREVRPDTVLTFGPDGMTGHPDHIAVSRWTTVAAATHAPQARVLWATHTPAWNAAMNETIDLDAVMMIPDLTPPETPLAECALYYEVTGAELDRKRAAIGMQASQVAPLVDRFGLDAFDRVLAEEAFRSV